MASKWKVPTTTASVIDAATPEAGEVIYVSDKKEFRYGDGATQGGVKLYPNTLGEAFVYGVDRDHSYSSPTSGMQKVVLNADAESYTNVSSFSRMPVHNLKRCVMSNLATRTVNYYLNASNSALKADGSNADLTGVDGDVMVEFPVGHYRIDKYTDDSSHEHTVKLISDKPFPGSAPFPAFYVSNGGSTLQAQYMGAFKASVDVNDKCRSIAGMKPTVNKIRPAFRSAAAANGGTLANMLLKVWLCWLAEIEFASTDVQSSISKGFSELSAYDPAYLRYCGRTASLGNGTGEIIADSTAPTVTVNSIVYTRYLTGDSGSAKAWKSEADAVIYTNTASPAQGAATYSDTAMETSTGYTVAGVTAGGTDFDLEGHWGNGASKVVSFAYRGVEDPWGACWEFDDGIQKYQDATVGDYTKSGYWFTTDTSKYTLLDSDNSYGPANTPFPAAGYTGANLAWVSLAWPKAGGYIKAYDPLTYFPTDNTGSSTTYLCDQFYNDTTSGARSVVRGGGATENLLNGAFSVGVGGGLAATNTTFCCRLAE